MARTALRMQALGFGRRLSIARKAAGFTQETAARELDVSRDTLSAWENAERNGKPEPDDRSPDAFTLRRICELYGVLAEWLLWGEATGL